VNELIAILTCAIGVMYLYVGSAKLMTRDAFAAGLRVTPLVPRRLVKPISGMLPSLEVLTGLGVILDMRWAKLVALLMLGGFTVVSLVAVHRDEKVPCNCFGGDTEDHMTIGTAGRNVLLMALVTVTILLPGRRVAGLTEMYGAALFALCMVIGNALHNRRVFQSAMEET
jgi:uncharacterized membrane protein YphA (DoxX/SURF4 family)